MSRRALVVGAPLAVFGCASNAANNQPVQTIRSSLDGLRKNIRKYVEDKHDRERALAKVDQLCDMMVEFNRIAFEWRARSHEAGPDDESVLLVIADDINTQMRAQLLHAMKVVYSLREDIPEIQWVKVFEARGSMGGTS